MMKKLYPLTILALMLPLSACGGTAPNAESPASESDANEAATPEGDNTATSASSMHAPELAQKVAELTAATWDGPKAAAQEVMLTIRIRVDSHPVSLKTNGEGIAILDGADGATAGDADADLTKDQAAEIVDGKTTLKQLVDAGSVSSNNLDGLKRFSEFLSK